MSISWLPGALAALAAPAGVVLGHKLKRRLWLRRWFLALIAFPLVALVEFSSYNDNLLLIAVALFSAGFYSGQWEVSLENPRLATLLGRRLVLWQIYGGVVAVFCIPLPWRSCYSGRSGSAIAPRCLPSGSGPFNYSRWSPWAGSCTTW